MAYSPLYVNPLGVLSRYGANSITTATPRKLKGYLSETRQLLKDLQIEFPPTLDAQVQGAFERLEATLRILRKRGDSREKADAAEQLSDWQTRYRNDFSVSNDAQATNSAAGALAVYGSEESLKGALIVRDPLYLADTGYFRAQELQGNLPEALQRRLILFVQTMEMYARHPTEEGLRGIRKALIEGNVYASLFGTKFLAVYRPQIVGAVDHFIKTCLTKPYGDDDSAHAIAESGLDIKEKEKLFTTTVDLAARLIEGFGGSLHYNFGEELTRAVAAFADKSNQDIGTLVRRLQSEQDPKARQKLVDEMRTLRDSAVRVGDHYHIPIPPPRIKVQHFQLPRPTEDLTTKLGS